MIDRLRKKLNSFQAKDRMLLPIAILALVLMALWIFQADRRPDESETAQQEEFGVTIPRGFLLLPLELANAASVSSMIHRRGVVDVFLGRQSSAIAANLRVIKLQAENGALFGALVPETRAAVLQDLFSRRGLRAAVKTTQAGPTTFRVKSPGRSLLTEIPVQDE
jgi:hypothetical protein